ncbi:DNA-binding protein [Paraburkholderia sp. J67]|uniref:DNA-binding protein n=1 Tax=Paraburkholderia sp. J67 TaxID=2805435 RepID=UPI002ABE198F|nr:DNA-binding protein [Paraburkholderia sp. J67]
MGRTPLNTQEAIRSVVLRLLDSAGVVAPITPTLFRQIVSARRVRDELGAGDAGWIGRQIRDIETEIVTESATRRHSVPGLPTTVADSMRALWVEALQAAQTEFSDARAQAEACVVRAEADRQNASAVTAMLRTELDDWQKHARCGDTRIGQLEAELAEARRHLSDESERARRAEARLAEVSLASDAAGHRHAEELATVTERYAGLSRQLLNWTDQVRQSRGSRPAAVPPEMEALRQSVSQLAEQYEELRKSITLIAAHVPRDSAPTGPQDRSAG